jgi:hypothetical protein
VLSLTERFAFVILPLCVVVGTASHLRRTTRSCQRRDLVLPPELVDRARCGARKRNMPLDRARIGMTRGNVTRIAGIYSMDPHMTPRFCCHNEPATSLLTNA